jgi:hypothetical protein
MFVNIYKISEISDPFAPMDRSYKETGVSEGSISRKLRNKQSNQTLVDVPVRLINPSILSES